MIGNIQTLWVDYNQRFICYMTVLYTGPWRRGPAPTQAFPFECLDESFAFQWVNFVPEGWASPMDYWTLRWANHSSHCPPVHESFVAARSGYIGQGRHIASTSIQWGGLQGIQAPGRPTSGCRTRPLYSGCPLIVDTSTISGHPLLFRGYPGLCRSLALSRGVREKNRRSKIYWW